MNVSNEKMFNLSPFPKNDFIFISTSPTMEKHVHVHGSYFDTCILSNSILLSIIHLLSCMFMYVYAYMLMGRNGFLH